MTVPPLLRRALSLSCLLGLGWTSPSVAQGRPPRTLILGTARFDDRLTVSEGGVTREPRGTGWSAQVEWGVTSTQSLRYDRASLAVRSPSGSDAWTTQTAWWRVYDGNGIRGLRFYGETGWAWRRLGSGEAERRGDGWAWGAGATYVAGSRVALDAGYQTLRVGSVRRADGTGPYTRTASERWFAGARLRVWPLR